MSELTARLVEGLTQPIAEIFSAVHSHGGTAYDPSRAHGYGGRTGEAEDTGGAHAYTGLSEDRTTEHQGETASSLCGTPPDLRLAKDCTAVVDDRVGGAFEEVGDPVAAPALCRASAAGVRCSAGADASAARSTVTIPVGASVADTGAVWLAVGATERRALLVVVIRALVGRHLETGGVTPGGGVVVGVAVAVEGLVLVEGEEGVDADELADGRVVFARSDVGEVRRFVGGLSEEGFIVGPGGGFGAS